MKATIKGHTYDIPDLWVVGFCHNGATVQDAVNWWHEQEVMSEWWNATEEEKCQLVDEAFEEK